MSTPSPTIAVFTSTSEPHSVLKDIPFKLHTSSTSVTAESGDKESHVVDYLNFLIDHYDNLEDYIVFLRADPLAHTPLTKEQFVDALKNHTYRLLDKTYWAHNVKCNDTGAPHHPGLQLKLWHERILGTKAPQVFEFCAGAQFMIAKPRILAKPKEFYKKILEFVNAKEFDSHTMERLWSYIF